MGAVYQGQQLSLKREIALKVLRPELSKQPGLVRRFNAEAELAAKLNHPNTVTLFDFGQDEDGSLFIAMEFVAGQSLREVIAKKGAQPTERILHVAAQVCSSLADAHDNGIVHRDLKPDNIMLSQRGQNKDHVTVLDFGIAKLRDENADATQQAPLTRQGDMLGTPQYMAPEQIRGESVDARTDVYAMGVILYELASGRLPFEANTVMALLSKHLTEEPAPLNQPAIPPNLVALIMECLNKDPSQRPDSMSAVANKLASCGNIAPTVFATQPPVAAGPSHSTQPQQSTTQAPHGGVSQNGQHTAAPEQMKVAHSATLVAPTKSKRSFIIILSMLILVGAGVATYLATQNKPKEDVASLEVESDETAEPPGPEPVEPEPPTEVPEEPERIPEPTPEPEPKPEKKDRDKESSEQAASKKSDSANWNAAYRYHDRALPYVLQVPPGFEGGGNGFGNAAFAGRAAGHAQEILVLTWRDPLYYTESEFQQAVKRHLRRLGVRIRKSKWKNIRGARVLLGQVTVPRKGHKGDLAITFVNGVFYALVIKGNVEAYEDSKAFRRDFIHNRFDIDF
jgi:serine/threonine-protein kinase